MEKTCYLNCGKGFVPLDIYLAPIADGWINFWKSKSTTNSMALNRKDHDFTRDFYFVTNNSKALSFEWSLACRDTVQ